MSCDSLKFIGDKNDLLLELLLSVLSAIFILVKLSLEKTDQAVFLSNLLLHSKQILFERLVGSIVDVASPVDILNILNFSFFNRQKLVEFFIIMDKHVDFACEVGILCKKLITELKKIKVIENELE